MTEDKNGKSVFDHLMMERRFRKLPLDVLKVMRRWAFSQFLASSEWCVLSALERQVADGQPEFQEYIHREVERFYKLKEGCAMGEAYLGLTWELEQQGKRADFDGVPWFFRLPDDELKTRSEEYERERQDNLQRSGIGR